ncbi:MAG TPA: hypothetical protein VGR48_04730 [Terriglobales bacterium]|nr:hypothetical protein [Terriglobales bacterium]
MANDARTADFTVTLTAVLIEPLDATTRAVPVLPPTSKPVGLMLAMLGVDVAQFTDVVKFAVLPS